MAIVHTETFDVDALSKYYKTLFTGGRTYPTKYTAPTAASTTMVTSGGGGGVSGTIWTSTTFYTRAPIYGTLFGNEYIIFYSPNHGSGWEETHFISMFVDDAWWTTQVKVINEGEEAIIKKAIMALLNHYPHIKKRIAESL